MASPTTPMTYGDYLHAWPGVRFRGPVGPKVNISNTVLIHPGAIISLAQELSITECTEITAQAIIEGECIHIRNSTISGCVKGDSEIRNSFVDNNSYIQSATVCESYIDDGVVLQGPNVDIRRSVLFGRKTVVRNCSVFQSYVTDCLLTGGADELRNVKVERNEEEIPLNDTELDPTVAFCMYGYSEPGLILDEKTIGRCRNLLPDNPTSSTPAFPSEIVEIAGQLYDEEPPAELVDANISAALIQDAVITPSGHTYDREVITKWIEQSGTDPMTRMELSVEQLVPNRALQAQVEAWKLEHCVTFGVYREWEPEPVEEDFDTAEERDTYSAQF